MDGLELLCSATEVATPLPSLPMKRARDDVPIVATLVKPTMHPTSVQAILKAAPVLPPHVTPLSIRRTILDRIINHRIPPPPHKPHYNNYSKTLYAILRDKNNVPVWFHWSGLKCAVFYHKTNSTIFAIPDTATDEAMVSKRLTVAYQRAIALIEHRYDSESFTTCGRNGRKCPPIPTNARFCSHCGSSQQKHAQ